MCGMTPYYFSGTISYYFISGPVYSYHCGLWGPPNSLLSQAFLLVPLPRTFFLLMLSWVTTLFALFMPLLQCYLLRDAFSDEAL